MPHQCVGFRFDPFYLGKHYLASIIVLGGFIALLMSYTETVRDISPWWFLSLVPLFVERYRVVLLGSAVLVSLTLVQFWSEISWPLFLAIPLAMYLGCLTAVFIHNAAHNNFKPRWLNPIVGELCALQQLSAGLADFRVHHNTHHANPDDPEMDPHPSKGFTLLSYIDSARVMIGQKMGQLYFERFGDNASSRLRWKAQDVLLVLSRLTKTIFWFCLLGPKYFVLLFLPSYLTTALLFACINFFAHREQENGEIEILNLDGTWFWKAANALLFGSFYHKNHHLRPKLFNPKHLRVLHGFDLVTRSTK